MIIILRNKYLLLKNINSINNSIKLCGKSSSKGNKNTLKIACFVNSIN